MSSRQEVKVEHKVSVAAFTSRDEKWVGEGKEENTTEKRWEGESERRFHLNVTGKGVGGTRSIIFLDVFVVHKFHLDLL